MRGLIEDLKEELELPEQALKLENLMENKQNENVSYKKSSSSNDRTRTILKNAEAGRTKK